MPPPVRMTSPSNWLIEPMKSATKRLVGIFVDLVGVPTWRITPLVHDGDAARQRHRLFLVVGDDDEGDAGALLDVHQLELRVLAQLLVEGAERLVQQQQLGLLGQGAGQRHALALAARELVRLAAGQLRELHQIQHLARRASLRWAVVMSSCFRP